MKSICFLTQHLVRKKVSMLAALSKNLNFLLNIQIKILHLFVFRYMPGISKFNENIQMFTSVYRCETSLVQMNTTKFNEICDEILVSKSLIISLLR